MPIIPCIITINNSIIILRLSIYFYAPGGALMYRLNLPHAAGVGRVNPTIGFFQSVWKNLRKKPHNIINFMCLFKKHKQTYQITSKYFSSSTKSTNNFFDMLHQDVVHISNIHTNLHIILPKYIYLSIFNFQIHRHIKTLKLDG